MSLRKLLVCLSLSFALVACATTGGGAGHEPRSNKQRSAKTPQQDAAKLQMKMGREYLNKGEYETAHEKLERALDLDPKLADAHTLMAVLYERINRAQFAEKHYRAAAEINSDKGSANNNLGAFLCRAGRYDEAESYFQRALNDPFYKTPSVAYSNAGLCASQAGNMEKAEGYFRKALDANPKEALALYEMAQISFGKSDFLRARAFMQRFEAASPPAATALEFSAQIEDRLGDERAAAKYRQRLKTEFPDYEPGTASGGSP